MTLYPGICLIVAAFIIVKLYKLSDNNYDTIASDLQEGRWEKGKIGDKDNH